MKLNKKVVLLLVVILIGGFIYFNFFHKKAIIKNKNIDSIEGYGYNLRSSSTDIYKQHFKELKQELSKEEVDEEKYLKLISKMFIIDLYSLDLRIDNNDVGGVEFVYSDVVDSYKAKVQDTLYLYLESNLYGDRKQDLPVVSDVNIEEVNIVKYYYNNSKNVDNNAYEVKVSWDYIKELDYQKSAVLYFIHDGKKLSLVEIK